MKDCIGNKLAVGDKVLHTIPRYSHLVKGTIIAITPKKIRIKSETGAMYSEPDNIYIRDRSEVVKLPEI